MKKEQVVVKCRQTSLMAANVKEQIQNVATAHHLDKAAAIAKLEKATELLAEAAAHIKKL